MRTLFPLNAALAKLLIPWFVKRGISANQITGLSLLAGMAGALAFLEGTRAGMIWGGLGFFAANLLDECDGGVARATGTNSGLGSWLDTLAGCAVHAIFFASLGFGLSRQSSEKIWRVLGLLACLSVVTATVAYVVGQGVFRGKSGWRHPNPPRPARPDRMEWLRGALRTDFSLVVLAATIAGTLRWLLWGGVLGALLFWIPADLLAAARLRRTEPER
jgi:phosphatidylglycerophosphate synthase